MLRAGTDIVTKIDTGSPPRRRGYTIFLLFIVITVVSILAMSIYQIISEVSAGTEKHAEGMTAAYLAEAGLHRALWDLRHTFDRPLVTPRRPVEGQVQRVDEELLELLDIDRARNWSRAYSLNDPTLLRGGEVGIRMELLDVSSTPFSTFLDPLDRVPPYLDPYHLKRNMAEDRQLGLSPLGGWKGKLHIVVTATYRRSRRSIETWRSIHVTDVTPPGVDYSLFVESEEREYLRDGRFVLSNLDVPEPVKAEILSLATAVNDVMRTDMTGGGDTATFAAVEKLNRDMSDLLAGDDSESALKVIHGVSSAASDKKVKDTLDRLILSLDPRDWGRVRTNGSLFVQLPFFATDDIINYFVDASPYSRRRPEVGYLGSDNRLHDPYLSIYTLFEGRIYKMFHRLPPLSQGPATAPQEVPPQRYTINTKMNFPSSRPDTRQPSLLSRLNEHARSQATIRSLGSRDLTGSADAPFTVQGLMYFQKPMRIGGAFSGRGLVVCQNNIHVTGDIVPAGPGDRIGLVSLGGSIRLTPTVNRFRIHAALTAKHGLRGAPNQDVQVTGNLVVETLKREAMPRYFSCVFDAEQKNHLADNVVGTVARPPIVWRETGGTY